VINGASIRSWVGVQKQFVGKAGLHVGDRQDMFGCDCGIHHPEEVGRDCEKSLWEVGRDCGGTLKLARRGGKIPTARDMLEWFAALAARMKDLREIPQRHEI